MAGALDGVRVVDLTRVVAGPLCAQMLGDLGADVAKVERRGDGDDLRALGPPFIKGSDDSAYFVTLNRNKRSVSVDFAKPEGAAILKRMVANADVLIENFRPGTLARYGLGWEELRAVNPRLIYCSVTGFGQTGPYAGRSGYDFVAQAMAGLMEVTGEADGAPGGGPQRVGVPVADMFTGFAAAVSILAALRHRDATGEGQYVEVSLFETMMSLIQAPNSSWLNTGRLVPRSGNDSPVAVPYGVFEGSDGRFVIGVLNDREFVRLAAALGHPEWSDDPRFKRARDRVEHRAALLDRMRTLLKTRPRAEWLAKLEEAKITSGPINTAADVEADPHIQARGMIIDVPHHAAGKVRVPASPLRLSATPVTYRHGIPAPGGDTEEVLADFAGMDAAEIAAAKAAGVV
ncbi:MULTISPECIES: CaiB/BaiF CoA transferase family protein [Neoroseomonas]|uniref:CoA transferase n=2 Tax=Neoroseomonas TaxID=2870716 RepID=A0A9X9WME4_9PROT|nr:MULTISPECIES: CoA transferase [Neoroseomonas]MBR0661504.1 CoA transferase [Neoroseomonas oryzicola]NKE19084.1 CoA transferase [Neoroseomonas oryzicola]NMJ40566.1 CoA transferase [Neoroseomonas marina]